MQSLALTGADRPFSFEGAISVLEEGGCAKPLRHNHEDAALYTVDGELPGDLATGLLAQSDTLSGVRIRLASNTTALALTYTPTSSLQRCNFDVVLDGAAELTATQDFPPQYTGEMPVFAGDIMAFLGAMHEIAMSNAPVAHTVKFEGLPGGEKVIELWLPTIGGCNISKLEIDEGATAAVAPDSRPRWLTYGSSITHCMGLDPSGTARSPSRCWPAVCAQKAGVHLTNLGYGGQCHMDQAVARMIRDLPIKPDGFSFKLGINIHNMVRRHNPIPAPGPLPPPRLHP